MQYAGILKSPLFITNGQPGTNGDGNNRGDGGKGTDRDDGRDTADGIGLNCLLVKTSPLSVNLWYFVPF